MRLLLFLTACVAVCTCQFEDINKCSDPASNKCDVVSTICKDTFWSYECPCKNGYERGDSKFACNKIDINECNDPAANECDWRTTYCKNTVGSYECPCKGGYERGDSKFICNDINECERNSTICGALHKCSNIVGSYECICGAGYQLLKGSNKKVCEDIDECSLSPIPCTRRAMCINTDGAFKCECEYGYEGDGIKSCTIQNLCVPKKNNCDPKSTKCVMLKDKPSFVCECLEGFEKQSGVPDQCIDIDECADNKTLYDRESVTCKNLPGTYELQCKDLYKVKSISEDKKNITCVDIDECASDPAFAETMKKVASGQNKGSWKEWMVVPKNKTSAYGICYYNALENIHFNSLQPVIPLADKLMPMCLNLSPNQISNQTLYEPRLKGFECTCPDPAKRQVFSVMKRFGFSCPSSACPGCRADLNFECVDNRCQCKKGYSARTINGATQCTFRECGNGEPHPAQLIASGNQKNVKCDDTNHYVPISPGFRIVRDKVTNVVIDCVDINECVEQPDVCCANQSKCTGPNCLKCKNTIGNYTCGSAGLVCDIASVDKNTCKCKAQPCNKITTWYADCDGKPTLKDLDKQMRVCSRIFESSSDTFKSFDNEQALFDYSVKMKCDCCFLAAKPKTFAANPVVNYYGPCQAKEDKVICPDGAKAVASDAGPWCHIKAKITDLPAEKTGYEIGSYPPNVNMCSPFPSFGVFLPSKDRLQIFTPGRRNGPYPHLCNGALQAITKQSHTTRGSFSLAQPLLSMRLILFLTACFFVEAHAAPVDVNECASDPAFAETMKKVESGQNKGSWKEWMVAPRDNSSGYAICYYNAMNNVKFTTLPNIPLIDTLMPMCLNLSPNQISNQTIYDPRLKGFECTCPPPIVRQETRLLKRPFFRCPNPGCPGCPFDRNYECVNDKCQCKKGYTERLINNTAQCTNRECDGGTPLPPQLIASGHLGRVKCDEYTFKYAPTSPGFRLVRDNVSNVVIDAVDINECDEMPGACCANESNESCKCTGSNCVKCVNKLGNFACASGIFAVEPSAVDKNTCKVKALGPCSKITTWYADCDGKPTLKDLDKQERVCSRIFDQNTNRFMTFDSEQALFDYSVKFKCDCCFLAVKPEKFATNPVVNYYGLCQGSVDKVVCPNGGTAMSTDGGPWCPIKAKITDFPSERAGDELGHGRPDPSMCSALPNFALLFPNNGRIEIMNL